MRLVQKISKITATATLILIIAGGLVTSTDSGLAVPDWPLSYGTLFPPMVGGILFEHSHRLIAGFVLILTLILVAASLRQKEAVWPKKISLVGLALVLMQALLGGMTVLFLLPKAISVSHAALGQTFFALTVSLAWTTSDRFTRLRTQTQPALNLYSGICLGFVAALYAQLFLGAWVRHSHGSGIILHIVGAFCVLVWAAMLFGLTMLLHREEKTKVWPSCCVLMIVLAQWGLGIGSLMTAIVHKDYRIPAPALEVLITTAHQTTGALLLAASFVLTVNACFIARPDSHDAV
jgi:cytochrome c oxidase assembly protein subunit 15